MPSKATVTTPASFSSFRSPLPLLSPPWLISTDPNRSPGLNSTFIGIGTEGSDSPAGLLPFCLGPLWNSRLTWDSDHPDFTPCFHKTVLVLIPAAVLWLLLPLELYLNKRSRSRGTPWSWINVSKLVITMGLTLVAGAELADCIYQVKKPNTTLIPLSDLPFFTHIYVLYFTF